MQQQEKVVFLVDRRQQAQDEAEEFAVFVRRYADNLSYKIVGGGKRRDDMLRAAEAFEAMARDLRGIA